MKNARPRRLVPLALAAALVLSACSGEETATFEAGEQDTGAAAQQGQVAEQPAETDTVPQEAAQTTGTEPAAQQPAGSEGDGTTEQSATAAGVNLLEVGEPLGTATIPAAVDRDPEATMDVSLYSLRRDGNTLVAVYSFTVHSVQEGTSRSLFSYLGSNYWTPFLVDTTNLARHDVLGGGDRSSLTMTSDTGNRFSPGPAFFAYASFAAPPDDVTTMTVHLVDGAPGIPDVEIQ